MFWLGFLVLILVMAVAGIRRAQRAGMWSWSKFALTLGFMAIVCAVITAPIMLMDTNGRYFWWVYGAAWAVALGLMVCYIIWARHWKLPGGRQK
jgi:hypothetical protein